jgi:hypothetical protein
MEEKEDGEIDKGKREMKSQTGSRRPWQSDDSLVTVKLIFNVYLYKESCPDNVLLIVIIIITVVMGGNVVKS